MRTENQIVKNNNLKVEAMALKIANESPELKDLSPEQLEKIAHIVITQNLTNELSSKAKIANINFKMERDQFIMVSSKTASEYTQSNYFKAIKELERFTKKNNINPLQMTPAQADDFIYSLNGSPNSKSIVIAGVSSFYTYLERRYTVIKNPIRGTKARPEKKTVNELEIPDEMELMTILNSLPEIERMAVYIMAYRGLRVGALKKLKVWGNNYQSVSKGKSISGEFPIEVICNIKGMDMFNKTPFETLTTNALKLRIYRQTMKMYKQGKISAAYSAHDFRHYYAIKEYEQNKDIYRLSKLLDHSNIAVTESYLRSLKIAA